MAMPPLNFIILVLFIIISVVLYLFDLQKSAGITFLFGLLTFILDKIPSSGISIKIERVNQTTHKVIIRNLGSLKISKIQYVFSGRMRIDDLPTRLDAHQIVEFPVGLSFETGTRLDVEVSYLPQFGLSRKRQHIQTQAIG